MQDDTSNMFGNITPADNIWQNPFDTWKNAGMSAPSAPQAKNKPAFDLRQAIQRLTESVRASMNHANQQMQTNMAESSNTATAIPAMDSAEPTACGNQQTISNAVPTQALATKRENPPQFPAKEQTATQSEVPSPTGHTNNQQVRKINAATRYNSHNNSNRYAKHDSSGTALPASNSNDEEDSFWNKIVGAIGQYGDGGTVPTVTWFDVNSPEDLRILIQDLQKYKPYIQAAADEAYEKLPDVAYEAASLVIPKLPHHLRGTALGALIVLGVCLCAKEAYDEWDERSGKEGLIVLFSDKLMFYFTEEWVENITDTFGIPKKYSRPILFAVKDVLSKAND